VIEVVEGVEVIEERQRVPSQEGPVSRATSRNSINTEDTETWHRDSQRNRNCKGFFQQLSQFAVPQ